MKLLLLLAACGDPEPVLQAVTPPRTPEEVAEQRERAELRASPANLDASYTKAEGVYVDARYLGGRRYDAVRAEIEQQLGAVVEEREAPGGAREVVFERGSLRLSGGTIQMVDVPLPEPVRRCVTCSSAGAASTRPANASGRVRCSCEPGSAAEPRSSMAWRSTPRTWSRSPTADRWTRSSGTA
ncbi:MAG: hypothetical protein ACK4YP_25260, partial [Myxococcota bacterium]